MRGGWLACCALILAACSSGDHEDLREWLREHTKDLRGAAPKLPEAQPYSPVAYTVEALADPFRASRIDPQMKSSQQSANGLQPDFSAREARNSLLEKYPLESLHMIGYLNLNHQPIAVVQVEKIVKQVKVGDYLGLDFGRVIRITENEILVREVVGDPSGEWEVRENALHLQVTEGTKK